MAEMKVHSTILELSEPAPAAIAVGSDISLKVKIACPEGCDLSDLSITIAGPDGEPVHVPASPGAIREIALKAPEQLGEHVWRLSCPAQQHAGVRHEACALAVSIRTKPHTTSLAVWEIPSPVVIGERFSVKVGAKSSSGCPLAGRQITVSDANGAMLAQGRLRDGPWPGTSALYWTDVELPAPQQEGLSWYAVHFAAGDAESPHNGSASRFSVAVVRPPEHRLIIEVLEKDTGTPIEDAQIRLGAYQAATDPSGRAEVAVPGGSYDLTVWKVGYDAPTRTIEVTEDIGIQIEAVIVPPENPDAAWIM